MDRMIFETMHFREGLQLVKDLFIRSLVFIQMVTQTVVFILTGAMFELQMMEQGQFTSSNHQPCLLPHCQTETASLSLE